MVVVAFKNTRNIRAWLWKFCWNDAKLQE